MKSALYFLILLACAAMSVNYGDRHGDNYFTSEGNRYFPIIWDVRGARNALSAFYRDYGGTTEEGGVGR